MIEIGINLKLKMSLLLSVAFMLGPIDPTEDEVVDREKIFK